MSEREPITAELRRVMNHTTMAGIPLVEIGEYEFGHRCDAIDAVHAALERENAELRQRVAELDNRGESMHETDAWKLGYDEGFASADDWMADNEDAMVEHGWIRLPLDADGVPIRVGDEVVEVDEPDVPRTVTSVTFAGDGWWVYINGVGRRSDKYRHHHAPTVEDVLREFAYGLGVPVADSYVAATAANLRLAGDAS